MKKKRTPPSKPSRTFRDRAETAVRASRTDVAGMSPEKIQRLVHELQVHQIELEMQNEDLRLAQAEVSQSRDRFNDLYDFAPVGYVTLDPDGTVLEANLTVAKMLGTERQGLVGRKFARFGARAAQDTLYLHRQAVLGGGEKQWCELLLRRADGITFAARMETIPIRADGSGTVSCRSAISDITERKRAEKDLAISHAEIDFRATERTAELRESERTALAVVDGLTAHIAIVDASGRIIAVNARWRKFAKRNGGSFIAVGEGANYLAVCDGAARHNGCAGAEVAAGIRKVLKGKLPEFSAEYPCHSPNQQRWFIVRVTPIPGNGPRRALVSHENITARVLAEQAVRREQEFSERVIHTVQTIVLLLSPEGKIVRFNRRFEELSGWSLKAARGRDWFDTFLPARDRARIRKLFRRALRGPRTQGNINPIVTKDGRELEIEWDDAPLEDAEGRLVGLLCSGRDITERRRAEAALRESEERYRQLIHTLPASVYTCDALGRITLYNAAAVKLWGREPVRDRDRWSGAHRLFTSDGKPLPFSRCPTALAVRQGEPIRDAELIIERPDGSRSHVVTFPDPTYDRAGTITGVLSVTFDTTALKEAENALRTSERSLRTLSRAIEQSPTSVLITTPSGEIDYVNPKFAAVTGYSLEEVLGKNPRLLKSGEQPPELYAEMWRTITAGREWRGELCNRKKNGELYWEFAVIAPIEDERGGISHFVAIKEDITERRRATEALRDREERLRTILNTVTDAIITIDRRGTIAGVNPATERMFGYTASELVGQNVSLLMPSPYHEEHDGYLANYHRTGQAKIIGIGREVQARRKDGSIFPIELAVSEVDHLHLFTGVIRDITERKRLEAEVLRIAEEERMRVAADLHDGLCQELVGIQFLSNGLRQDMETAGDPLAPQAARIERAIGAAAGQTRQVARGMNPVVADGAGLMHALRELAAETARVRQVACTFHCPAPVSIENPITANELFRIAQEAAFNAGCHSHAKRITLRLRECHGEIELAVTDNGRGLPADVGKARGMGLRVMQYRAGIIGGRLAIEPRRRGGTEVICRIPKTATTV